MNADYADFFIDLIREIRVYPRLIILCKANISGLYRFFQNL
jgi:hypothetical protein